jgi:CubicO group peptidase (beta-lactamase class C family)
MNRLFLVACIICALAQIGPAAPAVAGPDFPAATPESQGVPAEAIEALEAAVQGYIDKDHAVGAELLIIKNRKTILHEGFGLRDRASEAPMQPNTIFNIRSQTKALTGAAIQILIDRGKLALDDRAAAYLPGFDNEASGEITIEQLLTHRSGLPLTIVTATDEYPDLVSMANAVGERGPEYAPGSRFWYSDAGTDVLGAIVEVVSDTPLNEFVLKDLLEPLGMTDSMYPEQFDEERAARVATLYVGAVGSWTPYQPPGSGPLYPFAWGSQSLYSTTTDYARFLACVMDDGMVGDQRVLSAEAVQRMLTPVSKMSALGSEMAYPTEFPNLSVHYGQMMMLFLDEQASSNRDPVIFGHGGSDGTMAWVWPARDLMILLFTQSRGGLCVLRFEDEIDRHLLHPDRADVAETVPAEFEPYLGTYVANFGPFNNVEFTVLVQNGRLAVDIPGQLVFELKDPDEAGLRHFVMTDDVAVTFDVAETGDVTAMHLHQGGMTFDLPKGKAETIAEREFTAEELERYAGHYLQPESDQQVEISVDAGKLMLIVPDVQMPLELFVPEGSDLWRLRLNVSVKIRFNADEKGEITSFTAIMPDGTELERPRVKEDEESEP